MRASRLNMKSRKKPKLSSQSTGASPLPPNFPQLWDAIVDMRKERNAPVDLHGAECLAQGDDKTFRFQVLVSLMLSSQTKDAVTSAAMKRLQEFGLEVDKILETSEEKLAELLYGVGFYNRKAKYLKETAAILRSRYDGDIPTTLEELMELPGVGSKMAKLVMMIGWKQVVGISADTHVHRIANRLGWVQSKNPLETEKQLEEWMPREYWKDVNLLLVGLGQQVCLPQNPKVCQLLSSLLNL